MNESYNYCLKTFREMIECIQNGEHVKSFDPADCPLTLYYINVITGQIWEVDISIIQSLDFKDPRSLIIIDALGNKISFKEAITKIKHLDRMKAFW